METKRFSLFKPISSWPSSGLWLLPLFLATAAFSQSPAFKCGTFSNGSDPNFRYDYYDRFGNGYMADDLSLWNLNIQQNHCDQIEDFELIFEDTNGMFPFTTDEMETICDVFTDLSDLIDAPSGEKAIVRLSKNPDLDAETGAVGTAFFNQQCGLGYSVVQQQLFTGGVNTPQHALIQVNADITNFYIGPAGGIGASEIDFYTVILHEALHTLGFGSQITPSGASNQGFYTLWDLNLRNPAGDFMINATPGSNGPCCAEYKFNSDDFPNMPDIIWDQDCGPSNVQFDVALLPPVNGEYNPANQDVSTFMNVLSHLDRDCPGGEHYVMHSSIPDGLDGVQRTLTATEMSILCKLGYDTDDCDPDCIAVAADDGNFFVGLNQSISIDFSALLSNDFPTNATLTYKPDCGNHNGLAIIENPGQFDVEGQAIGAYTFCYTITSCDGRQCDVGTVRVVVTNPAIAQACQNLEPCQINPFWDFELFGSDAEMRNSLTAGNIGFDFWQDPLGNNDNTPNLVTSPEFIPWKCNGGASPQISTTNGNQFCRLVLRRFNNENFAEGVAFPLCEPIFPGMSGTISFIATTPNDCLNFDPSIRVEFSENPPVVDQVVYNNPGISSPSWFVPITSTPTTNPVFATYTLTFTNESSICWNFLYLSSFASQDIPFPILGSIYFDAVRADLHNSLHDILEITTDIAPVEPCIGSQVNLSIEICNDVVCNGNEFSNPPIILTTQLPTGLTHIPTVDFPSLTHHIPSGGVTYGECLTLELIAQVGNDLDLVGQLLPINLTFGTPDVCYEEFTIVGGGVTPILCEVLGFTCPCTGSGSLNIDAGDAPTDPNQSIPGLSVTSTALDGGNPSQNSYNNSGKCIAIKGHLLIDNNFNLSISGGEMRMQPGAKIIVKKGARLELKGVKGGDASQPTQLGVHGCEQMWRGIVVESGGTLSLSGKIIQDAEFMANISGGSGANMSSFHAGGNDFDRNHIGIRVSGGITQPFPFSQNKFQATSQMLPVYSTGIPNWHPLRPFVGIDLHNTIFTVGQSGIASSENLFHGLRNGITTYKANLGVYFAKFTKIIGGLGYTQQPNWGDNLSGLGIGARGGIVTVHDAIFGGEGSNGWRAISTTIAKLEAKRNDMYDITSGIFATPGLMTSSIVIEENKFSVNFPSWGFGQAAFIISGTAPSATIKIKNNNPVRVRGTGPAILLLNNGLVANPDLRRVSGNHIFKESRDYEGIMVDNSGRWTIDGNFVNCSGFPDLPAFSGRTRGIFLSASDYCYLTDNDVRALDGSLVGTSMMGIELLGSDHCTLCCNTTDKSTWGNYFMGNCDPAYLRAAQMYDHYNGLYCDGIGTVIGDQDWNGNRWYGTYDLPGIAAVHGGSQQNIEGSEFRVEPPMTSTLWPNFYWPDDPDYWFKSSQLGSSGDCSQCPPLPPAAYPDPPRDLTDNEKRIAGDTYASAHPNDRTTQREGERGLYREMKAHSYLYGQDLGVNQFYTAASTGAIGQLYEVENQTAQLGTASVSSQNRSAEIVHILDSLAQVCNNIDLLYASAQNATDSTALMQQKQALFTAAQPLLEEWVGIHDALAASVSAAVPNILSLNNAITANDLWSANRKTVNRIFIETIAQGNYTATAQQLSDLLPIANQCMLLGGDAVPQARALYNSFVEEPLTFDDADLCGLNTSGRGASEERGMSAAKIAYKANIIPNPAQDRFAIQVQGATPDAILRVEIVSISGAVLANLTVQNGHVLSQSFSPGLYLCHIYVGEDPADVVKLIIVP